MPKYNSNVRCCCISALVLTQFRLTKGRTMFFRPETIVASFLHLMLLFFQSVIKPFFKTPLFGAPLTFRWSVHCKKFHSYNELKKITHRNPLFIFLQSTINSRKKIVKVHIKKKNSQSCSLKTSLQFYNKHHIETRHQISLIRLFAFCPSPQFSIHHRRLFYFWC